MEDIDFSAPKLTSDEVIVRPGEMDDIPLCSHFDGSYSTSYVWQMQLKESEFATRCAFTRVRLPRKMPVMYPFHAQDIWAMLQKVNYLLVADIADTPVAFVCGTLLSWQKILTVDTMIVSPDVRRQGIGKSLFGAVKLLAQRNNCSQISIPLQTKNDPAIAFVQKQSAVMCGYNDHLFPNGDIALLYSLSV